MVEPATWGGGTANALNMFQQVLQQTGFPGEAVLVEMRLHKFLAELCKNEFRPGLCAEGQG